MGTFPLFRSAALLLLGALAATAAAETLVPKDIIERADRIRFPADGFQMDVVVKSTYPDRDEELFKYRVLSKGNENTVVLTTYPASERGRIMLMKDNDLWVFLPNVSQPVRLPLSQRLSGQVSNGDLARANFAGDYDARVVASETIDGQDHYVLDLTAARRGVTYHQVKYWVNKADFRPYKAEFYTKSGRLLKEAYYQQYGDLGGTTRPTQMLMVDKLREGERSTMYYANMEKRALPDKVFTKEYLKKLQ